MTCSSRIQLLGCEVYYEYAKSSEGNDAYCFLLVHGFLGSSFTFRRLFPMLARRHDVYAIDLIGFGKSEKSRAFQYSYYRYATMINAFIKTMKLDNVIVIGHSMGGQIALYTAKFFPERIVGLVLIGSSSYLLEAPRLASFLSRLPIASWGVRRLLRRYKIEAVLKNTLFNEQLITDEMVEAYRAPLEDKNFPYTLLGLIRDREGDLPTKELETIELPTLLIWGEEDEIVPIRTGLSLAQDLNTSQFSAIPDAGHQVIEEKPNEVFDEIQKWLQKYWSI